ncbi:MAG: outer membrane protein transport protein [Planctomycetes bacterium]|nr:outer membrane protein transport protein [Planctomycetota bacterium]
MHWVWRCLRGLRGSLTVAALAAPALLLLAAPSARASDGPAPAFFGARGPVALPAGGDPQTAYRMPSGVGWALENQIDLDLFFVYFAATARNSLNDVDKSGGGAGMSFGAVFVPDVDVPVRLHVGFYPDQGALAPSRTRVRYTTFPDKVGLKVDSVFFAAATSIVVAPTSWFSLGASFHVIPTYSRQLLLLGGGGQRLELAGSPQINGVSLPGNPTYADFLDLVPNDATDPTLFYDSRAYGLHLSGLVSVTFAPVPDLAIGLAYRPRSLEVVPLTGEAKIDAGRTLDSALSSLDPSLQALFLATLPNGGTRGFEADYDLKQEGPYVPQSVRLSLAWWPTERLLLAGEVAWTEWHRAFKGAKVTLTDGSNEDFNFVVGGDRVVVKAQTRWKNRWTASTQVAFRVTPDLTLRAGAHWGVSPLNPDPVGSIGTPAFACTSVMGGGGIQLTEDVQLNVLLEWVFRARARSGSNTGAVTTDHTRYTSDQVNLHLGLSVWF